MEHRYALICGAQHIGPSLEKFENILRGDSGGNMQRLDSINVARTQILAILDDIVENSGLRRVAAGDAAFPPAQLV
jgi:hypothetical protein